VEEDEFVKVGIISYVRDAQLMALELLQWRSFCSCIYLMMIQRETETYEKEIW
jgi:hypothetical protein